MAEAFLCVGLGCSMGGVVGGVACNHLLPYRSYLYIHLHDIPAISKKSAPLPRQCGTPGIPNLIQYMVLFPPPLSTHPKQNNKNNIRNAIDTRCLVAVTYQVFTERSQECVCQNLSI